MTVRAVTDRAGPAACPVTALPGAGRRSGRPRGIRRGFPSRPGGIKDPPAPGRERLVQSPPLPPPAGQPHPAITRSPIPPASARPWPVAISVSDIRPADAAGATDEEIADTLLAIAPVTGLGAVASNRTARASVSAARWADPSSATYPTSKLPGTSDKASSSARPAARALTRSSSGTAARQTGNDAQSRSEHPQDHPQSRPEYRNLGAERTKYGKSVGTRWISGRWRAWTGSPTR